ncbi:C-type lectin [Exaiptasia diaphana]|nr:C-type lectin [Exaiptasia diaphana]
MSADADLVSFIDKEEEHIFDQYLKDPLRGHMQLAFSSTKNKEKQFFALFLGVRQGYYFWIGFNDRAKEGTFVWFDGTKSNYTNWKKGEPNNNNGSEHCTMKSQGSKKWIDQKCYMRYPFACKVLCS